MSDADGCSAACRLEWTCDPFAYADGHLCDCGCGSVDPDCNDATTVSCDTCGREGSCSTGLCPGSVAGTNNATCVGCGNGMPDTGEACDDGNNTPGDGCTANCALENAPVWTCNPLYYGANDGCNCGCGIVDPDCADSTLASCDGCNQPGSCSQQPCPGNINAVNNAICDWTCNPFYYADGNVCDCGCGIPDPDCADTTVASCQICDDPGSCGTGPCPANIDPQYNAWCFP
jgi:cysteine-rich repeat protein